MVFGFYIAHKLTKQNKILRCSTKYELDIKKLNSDIIMNRTEGDTTTNQELQKKKLTNMKITLKLRNILLKIFTF